MEEFNSRKREILEKVVPHFVNPTVYPMPKLSVAECAILLAKNESDVQTQTSIRKTELNALAKMRSALKKFNIKGISDVLETGMRV